MFKNSTISRRLTYGFSAVIIIMLVIALLAIFRLNNIGTSVEYLTTNSYIVDTCVNDIKDGVNIYARSMRNLIIYVLAQDNQRDFDQIKNARAEVAEAYEKLDPLVNREDKEELDIYNNLLRIRQEYLNSQNTFLAYLNNDERGNHLG